MLGLIKYTITIIISFIIAIMPIVSLAQPWQQYDEPEQAGFNQILLEQVENKLAEMNTATYLVTHRGKIVSSYGDISRRFMLHSMRKSLVSSLFGIYEAQGKINLATTLEELNINDKLGLTKAERSARIEDLLAARSGIYHPAAYEPQSMKSNRPERGSAKPGEQFFYNNWDFNVLATIFEQTTGDALFQAFKEHIAESIGMEDFRLEDAYYRYDEESIHPAYLFKMSARDLARYGQLILNDGRWEDKQIIPKGWISRSTALHSADRETGTFGYGYLWWIDRASFSEPCIYASGLGGQKLYIFPKSEMIVVHQVNTYMFLSEQEESIIDLIKTILAAKVGSSSCEPSLSRFKVESPQKTQAADLQNHTDYVGIYNHPFFGQIQVSAESYGLSLSGNVMGHFRIFKDDQHSFRIEDLPEMSIRFEPANDQYKNGQATTEMVAERIPKVLVFYY